MLIDWFTVGAQALNFVILVWLLKRFLYKPIIHAVDARENRIAKERADADAIKSEATKEREEFRKKNEAFDQQRAALLSKATDEAKAERGRFINEARKAADALTAKRSEALQNEGRSLNRAIISRAKRGAAHPTSRQGWFDRDFQLVRASDLTAPAAGGGKP